MSEPRMPKPGEVWESADGTERRLVAYPSHEECMLAYWGLHGYGKSSLDEWLGWTVRTGAKCILEARE